MNTWVLSVPALARKQLKRFSHTENEPQSVFTVPPKVNRKGIFRTPIKNPEIFWIKPQFNCEVKFLELDFAWEMRHASFKGLIE